jgi:hypothetical protein
LLGEKEARLQIHTFVMCVSALLKKITLIRLL